MTFTMPPHPSTPSAYVQVQATAQPASRGSSPPRASTALSGSVPAGAPPTPPNVGQTIAPAAGAAGMSDVARSSAPPAGHVAAASDNGGQLASPNVPGGTNHAPATGPTPHPFSAPIKKD